MKSTKNVAKIRQFFLFAVNDMIYDGYFMRNTDDYRIFREKINKDEWFMKQRCLWTFSNKFKSVIRYKDEKL